MLSFKEWLANREKDLTEVGTGTDAVARFTMPIMTREPPKVEDDDEETPKKQKKQKKS